MKVENFSVKVGNTKLIDGFTYDFNKENIYHIYGKNGAGKSSFAKAIAGYKNYNGYSEFSKANIGIIGSYTNIPMEVSVKDIITFLKENQNIDRIDYEYLYEVCQIKKIINRKKVAYLSDGEKKKLIIFSTLVRKKDVLILDEFISSLDHKSTELMRDFLINLKSKLGILMINITHSIRDLQVMNGVCLYLDRENASFTEIDNEDRLIERL